MGSPEPSMASFPWTQTALDQAQSAAEFPVYNSPHPGSCLEEGMGSQKGGRVEPWRKGRFALWSWGFCPLIGSVSGAHILARASANRTRQEWASLEEARKKHDSVELELPLLQPPGSWPGDFLWRHRKTPNQNQSTPVLIQSCAGTLNSNKKNTMRMACVSFTAALLWLINKADLWFASI